jgi:hypothetical protein
MGETNEAGRAFAVAQGRRLMKDAAKQAPRDRWVVLTGYSYAAAATIAGFPAEERAAVAERFFNRTVERLSLIVADD